MLVLLCFMAAEIQPSWGRTWDVQPNTDTYLCTPRIQLGHQGCQLRCQGMEPPNRIPHPHTPTHWDWKPTQNGEYTMVHATRHIQPRTPPDKTGEQVGPSRPTPQQWTLYQRLAHAHTLAEHNINPYTANTYVESMPEDWKKYETDILEGHRGPQNTTAPMAWDDRVPNGDIGGLATAVQQTEPSHPFDDH